MKKQEIVDHICELICIPSFRLSSGSSEPKDFFIEVCLSLGIPGSSPGDSRTKPEIARQIVQSLGLDWQPEFESVGSTVTRAGLLQVLKAVELAVLGRNQALRGATDLE